MMQNTFLKNRSDPEDFGSQLRRRHHEVPQGSEREVEKQIKTGTNEQAWVCLGEICLAVALLKQLIHADGSRGARGLPSINNIHVIITIAVALNQ